MSEVLSRLHFNTAVFCDWYEARAAGRHLQKRWKTDLEARRVYDEESLKKVAVFQWSNKFGTVLTFFFRFIVECFSKHPQTRHDILNATTLRFEIRFSNKSRDFAYLRDFVTNFGYAVTQVLLA